MQNAGSSMRKNNTADQIVRYLNGYLNEIKDEHDNAKDRNDKAKWLLISADVVFIKKRVLADYIELEELRKENKELKAKLNLD